MKEDQELLRAALIGYQVEVERLEAKIAEIKAALGGGGGDIPTPFEKPRKKRKLSAAARKRIADAQKRRWAAVRAENKA